VLVGVWFLLPAVTFLLTIAGNQSDLTDSLSWAGYGALAFFSIFFTLVLARDFLLTSARVTLKFLDLIRFGPKRGETSEPSDGVLARRQFLVQTTNLGILGIAAPLMAYGVYEARRRALLEEITVPLKDLPPAFDGFRIVQFSDLHCGPTIKRRYVERLVEQLHGLQADCIVFTGDLVDGSVPRLRKEVAPLRELATNHDLYFVTGNHEYYWGAQPWVEEAARIGFKVLLNEHRVLQKGEASIVLAGVTDYGAGSFIPSHASSPKAALDGSPSGAVKILLAHQPKSIYEAEAAGVHLQLSGHTHGGQFFPWDYLGRLAQPYIKGLHKHGRAWVYVTRGVGYWGPPIRLGIPPEVTIITLKTSFS
jgi:predicted MPP superfamily phosphohydrolase